MPPRGWEGCGPGVVRSQRIYHLNAASRHSDAADAARMRFIIAVGSPNARDMCGGVCAGSKSFVMRTYGNVCVCLVVTMCSPCTFVQRLTIGSL